MVSGGSANITFNGTLNEDSYYALFAYCLLSGQVLTELHKNKELRKQMTYAADSVLDPSNLTSRVTVLVATLRKLKVSSKAHLAELGKLQWL